MSYRAIFLVLFATLAFNPSHGADEPAPSFDVEIIVFRHLDADESEQQLMTLEEPDEDQEEQTPIRRRRYPSVPSGELRLGAMSQLLLRSKQYSSILHYGWRQPGESRETAAAVTVAGSRAGALVSGMLRLSLERFLRLELDLEIDPGTGTAYKLTQARRVRSGETHYFDHPQFGVIVLVSKSEPT